MLWTPETSIAFPCIGKSLGGQGSGLLLKYHPYKGQSPPTPQHHPAAQIKEATKTAVMLSEQKESGRQNHAGSKKPWEFNSRLN